MRLSPEYPVTLLAEVCDSALISQGLAGERARGRMGGEGWVLYLHNGDAIIQYGYFNLTHALVSNPLPLFCKEA